MNKKPHQFSSYKFNATTSNNSSPPAFSPAPDTPMSNSGVYSPFNSTNSLILPSTNSNSVSNQRRKSKQQQQNIQSSSNKRRKSSNVNVSQDQSTDQVNPSPITQFLTANQSDLTNKDDQNDIDIDQDDDEARKELNDDDYSVRKREDLINKDKLKILLEHFDPQQMDRYTEYRNSGLAKANIRKLANTILQQSVSERVTIVIRGFAKVFVGHMVEQALDIQKQRGGSGGLTPYDLKQAYQLYLRERDRGGSDRRKMFIK